MLTLLLLLLCISQFYEADEQHKRKEAEMSAQLEELERDAEQHQAVLDGLTAKYMETIERLQSDKARLEVRTTCRELSFYKKLLVLIWYIKIFFHIL